MGKIGSDCAILKECEEFLDSQVRIGIQCGEKKVLWAMPGNYVPPAPMEYTPREKIHHEKEVDRVTVELKTVLNDLLNIARVHSIKLEQNRQNVDTISTPWERFPRGFKLENKDVSR